MKIKTVKVWRENLQLTKPYTIAFQTTHAVENIFVYLELENGVFGIGAASPAETITGENFEHSYNLLQNGLEALLRNEDILKFQDLIGKAAVLLINNPAALAAVDIALHDAFTKYRRIPLIAFWGARHKGMLTSVTIGIMSPEETVAEAQDFVAKGFKIIKLKIGKDPEIDIECLAKLREAVGKNIKIRVDANQGYTRSSFITFFEAAKPYDVEFYEQPLKAGSLEEMRALPIELRLNCAADEDLHFPNQIPSLINPSLAYGVFNIKLMKCGGLLNGRRIAEQAQKEEIKVMWGCMDESIISITAALNLAMACEATHYLDLDGSLDLAKDVVSEGFILKDGYMYLNSKPGLGITLI